MVTFNFLPLVNAGSDVSIALGTTTSLTANGAVSFQWLPSLDLTCDTCTHPDASPQSTTTYTLLGTDINGCTAADTITIYVNIICNEPFIPNAFSPNGDGENDKFLVQGVSCVVPNTFLLSIYDRWGNKIIDIHDPTQGWDGAYNLKDMNTDGFFYYFSASLINGISVSKKGSFSLIK